MNKLSSWKAIFFLSVFCAGTAIILPAQASGFWGGSYSVSTCNTPGYIGSGDPCSYIVWSLAPGDGGHGSNTAELYVGPNQANNVRYEQEFDAEFCSAGSGVDLSTANSWGDTEDLTNVFLSGAQSTTLTFTVTQRTPTLISGTFAGSFEYPTSSGTAKGQITGQWSLTPLSVAFPKCITKGYEWCYESGIAANALSGTGTGSCPFLYPTDPAPAGEWGKGCKITSQTVAQQPANTDRKILGVGEEVNLTLEGGDDSTAWQLEGPGTLSPQGQNAVLYMADDTTGAATITATADVCKEQSEKFKVIAPSKVMMQNPSGDYIHTEGYPDIGFQANVYIGPDTVSFYNVAFEEVNAPFKPTGVYACDGQLSPPCGPVHYNHCSGSSCPSVLAVNPSVVVPGLGTQLDETDCVYSGQGAYVVPPYKPGSVTVSIPWQWFLDAGNQNTFISVEQKAELEGSDKSLCGVVDNCALMTSKAGVTVSKNVDSADGTLTDSQCLNGDSQ
jgi:hypothetical protein